VKTRTGSLLNKTIHETHEAEKDAPAVWCDSSVVPASGEKRHEIEGNQ
jgi:hypothetical protein